MSFAVDAEGALWVLGGKLSLQDDELFPRDISSCFFNVLSKTELNTKVKIALQIPDSTQVKVAEVIFTETLFVIMLELTDFEA